MGSLKAINFKESNHVFGEAQTQYNALPVFIDPNNWEGKLVTCWELDDEALKEIVKTKKLWLFVCTFGQPLQPLFLQSNTPFLDSVEQSPENLEDEEKSSGESK